MHVICFEELAISADSLFLRYCRTDIKMKQLKTIRKRRML